MSGSVGNLYLIIVIGHGRILAEDGNMFSSVVFNGSLSDESLKDMMSVAKKKTERPRWGAYVWIPEQGGVLVDILRQSLTHIFLLGLCMCLCPEISPQPLSFIVNSYSFFSFQLSDTFSKRPCDTSINWMKCLSSGSLRALYSPYYSTCKITLSFSVDLSVSPTRW